MLSRFPDLKQLFQQLLQSQRVHLLARLRSIIIVRCKLERRRFDQVSPDGTLLIRKLDQRQFEFHERCKVTEEEDTGTSSDRYGGHTRLRVHVEGLHCNRFFLYSSFINDVCAHVDLHFATI